MKNTKLFFLGLFALSLSNYVNAQNTSFLHEDDLKNPPQRHETTTTPPNTHATDVIVTEPAVSTGQSSTTIQSNCISDENSNTLCGSNAYDYCNSHSETDQCRSLTPQHEWQPDQE